MKALVAFALLLGGVVAQSASSSSNSASSTPPPGPPPPAAASPPPPAASSPPPPVSPSSSSKSSGSTGSPVAPPSSRTSSRSFGPPPPSSSKAGSGPGTPTTRSSVTNTAPLATYESAFPPPDVQLSVPDLSVGRIELDVDNLQAELNLNANVAQLVTLNAGVAASIKKVNLTITDVKVELDLEVRLGNLAAIVNRVFKSLDLNPLLITVINNVTSLIDTTVGAVEGLLGSITQGGNTLSFLIDNLGNIVQSLVTTAGQVTNTIVGDFQNNMTYTGKTQQLGNGLVQKQYSYSPLNALVNIVFNALGQVVQATVVKGPTSSSSAGAGPTPTAKLSGKG